MAKVKSQVVDVPAVVQSGEVKGEEIQITEVRKAHDGLAQAKLGVMRSVGYIRKKQPDKGGRGGLTYSYLSEEEVVERLHEAFLEHSLVILPVKVEMLHVGQFTTKSGTPMNHVLISIRYRITHADSGQSEEGEGFGEAMDAGDKASNKASTGAFKYFLRQAFLIPTGDDPDATPSSVMERPEVEVLPKKARIAVDDSFQRCREAVLAAPNIKVLEHYRAIYAGRGYSTEQLAELEELARVRIQQWKAGEGQPSSSTIPAGGRSNGKDVQKN